MRADEALQAVTYFIDDAIQVGCTRVRIYSTGTGVLRQVVRQYLKTVSSLSHFQTNTSSWRSRYYSRGTKLKEGEPP